MTVRLLFTRSKLPGSYLIRALTWSEYSHVQFITKDNQLIGAGWPHGVAYESWSDRISTSTKHEICTVDADYAKTLEFLKQQLGKPYDLSAVFGIMLHRDWEQDDRWFCSEVQTAALKYAGVEVVKKATWRVTPQDLLQSPFLVEETN